MILIKMNLRGAAIGSALVLSVLAIGVGAWSMGAWRMLPAMQVQTGDEAGGSEGNSGESVPLPIPPVPPRVAEGEDYERCMTMLGADPAGANAFAEAWEATGGGDGARHCLALAQVALGNPETGADLLEKLANSSHAADLARASVYGQAGQAWLMAGDASRAFAAATLALTLSPDDPDLLIDRSIAAATLERYQDTITDLDHALSIDPKRDDALVFRGAAYRHLNNMERAEDDIDHAVMLNPDNADALLERGILRQRQGNPEGARADWERAIALDPDTATADLAQQNLALLEAGPNTQ
jgi:tetratricopeptide (TPR) repeat protein